MAGEIQVRGLRELNRAFARADRELKRGLRDKLKEAAEPVRADAERLAESRISNVRGSGRKPWAAMRVGVTQKLVYVAPKQRGVTSRARDQYRRPNLAGLLMDRAMDPALEMNRGEIERNLEELLEDVEDTWGRG